MSNSDDIHENGAHNYWQWIKFGDGGCTDHASKDIRGGLLGRGQAIEMVKKYDAAYPSYIYRW